MATATTDVSISACTPERKEGFVMPVFEFLLSRSDVRLVKLGQGNFNDSATGLGDYFKGGQWVDNTPVFTILCAPIFFYIKHNGHLVTYYLDLRPPPIPAPTNQSQPLRLHINLPYQFRILSNTHPSFRPLLNIPTRPEIMPWVWGKSSKAIPAAKWPIWYGWPPNKPDCSFRALCVI